MGEKPGDEGASGLASYKRNQPSIELLWLAPVLSQLELPSVSG